MPSDGKTVVALTNVSPLQIDKALAKLQLVAPAAYDVDGKVELLRCSKVFRRKLEDYDDDAISLVFNKKGTFLDFETTEGNFDGLFCKSASGNLMYPCRVCANDVTDNNDTSGFGMHCDGCGWYFHNSCTTKPISVELFKALEGSPNYVKVLCPACNLVYGSADRKLTRIERKVGSLAETVGLVDKSIKNLVNKPSYSSVLNNAAGKNTPVLPTNVINSLNTLTKVTREKEDAERMKRTRVVVKSGNTNIRTSRDIRREFNKHYTGMIIKHCRLTAAGSIMFEFEDEEVAKAVHTKWSTDFFGGNIGMRIPGNNNTIGIVKYVYDDRSEQEMLTGIQQDYPDAECYFFKRKSDNSFNGMIKVDFKSRDTLLKVIKEKIKFCNQRYIVEEYVRKSRVIKCSKCQGWGHVHRYCTRTPKCGKCADNHESLSCTITSGFKCAHCGLGHKAGSTDCKVYKEKMALFTQGPRHE